MALITQNKVNDVKYNYLWGYNHRFPVAEVEGSDSSTIAGLINQSVLDNPANDAALRNELNKIRTGLLGTKALVTTSTYDPLAGMTSKTDPAGRTTYFEYDAMGRLADIKDLNGNIIKTYQYHLVN
jgi:YD repeat-containing protein